jgi:hypothetical protein
MRAHPLCVHDTCSQQHVFHMRLNPLFGPKKLLGGARGMSRPPACPTSSCLTTRSRWAAAAHVLLCTRVLWNTCCCGHVGVHEKWCARMCHIVDTWACTKSGALACATYPHTLLPPISQMAQAFAEARSTNRLYKPRRPSKKWKFSRAWPVSRIPSGPLPAHLMWS